MTKEKPFHHRIMDAGFSAALERNGFQRVSPVFYRRVYDLYEVHVILAPGFPKTNGPRSFLAQMGLYFPQLEPIEAAYRKVVPSPSWPIKLRNKSARAHVFWSVDEVPMEVCRLESVKEECLEEFNWHTQPKLFGLIKPSPSGQALYRIHKDIGPDPKYVAWAVREDRSLEDFTEEFSSYWQLQFDQVASGFSDKDALVHWILENRVRYFHGFGPANYAMLCALGRPDLLRTYVALMRDCRGQPLKVVIRNFWAHASRTGLDSGSKDEHALKSRPEAAAKIVSSAFDRSNHLLSIIEELGLGV